jgi:hypothetical protein
MSDGELTLPPVPLLAATGLAALAACTLVTALLARHAARLRWRPFGGLDRSRP